MRQKCTAHSPLPGHSQACITLAFLERGAHFLCYFQGLALCCAESIKYIKISGPQQACYLSFLSLLFSPFTVFFGRDLNQQCSTVSPSGPCINEHRSQWKGESTSIIGTGVPFSAGGTHLVSLNKEDSSWDLPPLSLVCNPLML